MTTPFGAESDVAGFSLGRGERPEDMVVAGIDAATGNFNAALDAVSPPPGVVMPRILDVEVPDAQPGEQMRTGAVEPESDTLRGKDDLLARIDAELKRNGVDPNQHFIYRRGAGHAAIAGFEGNPQDDPNAPGVTQ